jgi:hypothetical protein
MVLGILLPGFNPGKQGVQGVVRRQCRGGHLRFDDLEEAFADQLLFIIDPLGEPGLGEGEIGALARSVREQPVGVSDCSQAFGGVLRISTSQAKADALVLNIASFLILLSLTWATHLCPRWYGTENLLLKEHLEAPQAHST